MTAPDRFSTAARLRVLGEQAAERVYRAQNKRLRAPVRSRLTGRAALLALVLCTLVVALAYPMRAWVAQRAEIADQQRAAREAAEDVRRLREQKARWSDPAYVEQQAREHLHFVRPGERSFILPDGTAAPSRPTDRGPDDRPWYDDLGDALERADRS